MLPDGDIERLDLTPKRQAYIEVDVQVGDNSPYALHRMFSVLTPPVPARQMDVFGPGDAPRLHDVVGWSPDGPCQAFAALVEDSGEGQALLVYGGSEGIRLRPTGSPSPWDLADPDQSGEPCLLVDRATRVVTGDPPK